MQGVGELIAQRVFTKCHGDESADREDEVAGAPNSPNKLGQSVHLGHREEVEVPSTGRGGTTRSRKWGLSAKLTGAWPSRLKTLFGKQSKRGQLYSETE